MRSRSLSCALCAMLAAFGASRVVLAQNPQPQTQQTMADARIPSAQLDSLVAPIALYPDPLLAQVLAASTYPLEIVQMQQWLAQHADLKDQALVDAVSQQSWDPSVQSMAALPDVVKLLASDIKWVTDLGNAFLAQQSDVMDAVQRMRQKANASGKLKTNERLNVQSTTEGGENVIIIQQSDPQTIYVPSYNPTVVYGEPVAYAYPAVAYPPVGYYAAGAAISFGVGVAMGAAFHGGWGYGCGWGGGGNNNININRQNNFQRNSASGKWQHNPQHRGGTPYGNRSTNERFGGSQRNARAGMDRGGTGGDRGGQLGGGDRGGNRGGGDRGGIGGGDRGGNRGGGDRGGIGGGDRGGGRGGGGGERVGNRSVGNRGGGGGSSALGSGNRSGGYNGQAARQSSNRGSASRGNTSRPSGGASRGGGSRGGGRGGGGRGGRR